MRFVLVISALFSLLACRDEVNVVPKPSDLVPEDTMVLVLRDLSIIESHIQMKYGQASIYKDLMVRSGNLVFEKYTMNSDRFENSLEYYGSRQMQMQAIYARVIDSLNLMSGKISVSPQKENSLPENNGLLKIDLQK